MVAALLARVTGVALRKRRRQGMGSWRRRVELSHHIVHSGMGRCTARVQVGLFAPFFI